MADHERMFVEGSPDSVEVQTFPSSKEEALRYRASSRQPYCSQALGGCGQLLTIVIPDRRIPHLRHKPRSVCSLRGDVDRYTHLWVQHQVAQWCGAQGAEQMRLEVSVEQGRADVRCILKGTVYNIEVQLSPILTEEVDRRTAVYARDGAVVVWLLSSRVVSDPAPARPLLLTRTITESGLRIRLGDSHGFGSPEFPLEECTLHLDLGVSHPVWSAGAERRVQVQALIDEWHHRIREQSKAPDRVPHGRFPLDLGGAWPSSAEGWRYLAEQRTPGVTDIRLAGVVPATVRYGLVRVLMNTPASVRAGRPVNDSGQPVCLICAIEVSADHAVHPANKTCKEEWSTRRSSMMWEDNAEYVRNRMPPQ